MNTQRLGILTSLAIHAGFLVLFLTVSAANVIPYTKTFYISFAQQETSPSALPKEAKPDAKPRAERIQPASKQEITETNHRQEEVIINEAPVISTGQKVENKLPVKTEVASLGRTGIQDVAETVFGNFGAPAFIHRETPVYPYMARRLEKEGRVVLKLLIDMRGKLQNIEVIEPAGLGFTEAAVLAVKSSTFIPARRNGEKVAARAILSIRFRLK